MPDADPVEVAFAFARNALIQTSREPGWTQVAGRLLTAALEYAVQGVFIAWGFPVLAPKVRRYFDPSMTAHLQPADAEVIRAVWNDAGRSHADLDLSTIIGICAAVVDRLEALAGSPPPAGWSPPPVPASIGWAALSGADQQLLTRVRQGAQALCPEATVILFGSRATGLARPESDYDLLLILPDDIDPYVRALIMSNVRDMVRETGAAVDHEYVTVNTWQNPPPGARILVEQAKSQGIEVPDD